MSAPWTMGSYWRAIEAIEESESVSTEVARSIYSILSDEHGPKLFASFIEENPGLTHAAAERAIEEAEEGGREDKEREAEREEELLDDWMQEFDEAEDFDEYEVEGAFDYEEANG